ncbi:MAG: hypothetical protein LC754_02735 [Acidobacteria bacterium]|nr:hypothetical protein [Acidobacteriota bacterium]
MNRRVAECRERLRRGRTVRTITRRAAALAVEELTEGKALPDASTASETQAQAEEEAPATP